MPVRPMTPFVILASILAAASLASADTLAGPVLTQNEAGWLMMGVRFTALQDVILLLSLGCAQRQSHPEGGVFAAGDLLGARGESRFATFATGSYVSNLTGGSAAGRPSLACWAGEVRRICALGTYSACRSVLRRKIALGR